MNPVARRNFLLPDADFADHRRQVERLQVERDLSGLELGHAERAFDKRQHA